MSSTTLRLTQFKVQRLQCIGGNSRIAPYHITTYYGEELGEFGEVMTTTAAAGNGPVFEQSGLRGLKRLLAMFGCQTAGRQTSGG